MGKQKYEMKELIGKGKTAEIYAIGHGKICKLFFEGFPETAIYHELKNAKLLQQVNLPVPE